MRHPVAVVKGAAGAQVEHLGFVRNREIDCAWMLLLLLFRAAGNKRWSLEASWRHRWLERLSCRQHRYMFKDPISVRGQV